MARFDTKGVAEQIKDLLDQAQDAEIEFNDLKCAAGIVLIEVGRQCPEQVEPISELLRTLPPEQLKWFEELAAIELRLRTPKAA